MRLEVIGCSSMGKVGVIGNGQTIDLEFTNGPNTLIAKETITFELKFLVFFKQLSKYP